MKYPGLQTYDQDFAQLLMDSNPQYIFWKNTEGVYLGCNKLYAYFCNLSNTSDIIGTSDYDYMDKDEADICIQADKDVMKSGDAMLNFEEYVTDAHGDSKWYNINKVPLKNKSGIVVGVLGTMTDVSEIKQKNSIIEDQAESLKNQLDELANKNKELEQFTYAAAHDLQEPLRNIVNFTELLSNDKNYNEEYVNHIINNSKRLSQQIKGLLDYSLVDDLCKLKEHISLQEVFEESLSTFAFQLKEIPHLVDINVPVILKASKYGMNTLFQNIFSNAIKYRKPNIDLEFHVSIKEETDTSITIDFADNGVGFDQKHANKIFSLFRRLYLDNEYDGVGMGLSICKKIIEFHNGEIYVNSTLGTGSNFYIKLKKEA